MTVVTVRLPEHRLRDELAPLKHGFAVQCLVTAVVPSSDLMAELTPVNYVPAVYETELSAMTRSFSVTSASRWTLRRLSGGIRARGAIPGNAAGARRLRRA